MKITEYYVSLMDTCAEGVAVGTNGCTAPPPKGVGDIPNTPSFSGLDSVWDWIGAFITGGAGIAVIVGIFGTLAAFILAVFAGRNTDRHDFATTLRKNALACFIAGSVGVVIMQALFNMVTKMFGVVV